MRLAQRHPRTIALRELLNSADEQTRRHMRNLSVVLGTVVFVSSLIFAPFAMQSQDVGMIVLMKGQEYVQDNALVPWLGNDNSSGPLFLNAFVIETDVASVDSASLATPAGTTAELLPADGELRFEEWFKSKVDLDAAYGPGSYRFDIQGAHDGFKQVTLTLSQDNYPNVPRMNNYGAAQQINAGSDFTLTWDAFNAGTVDDLIMLQIWGHDPFGMDDITVFMTGVPGDPTALDGTATQVVVPAGTLEPGRSYTALLTFAKAVDANDSYGPGVMAFAVYIRQTFVSINTVAQSDSQPPTLIESRPQHFQGAVPRNSAVAFEFSEPMNTNMNAAAAVTWIGVNGGSFTYRWSTNRHTLFCIPNTTLPPATTIFWILNPDSASVRLRDLSSNPLPMTPGQFTTSEQPPASGDVAMLHVAKGIWLRQSTQAGSAPTGISFLDYSVELSGVNTVLGGWLTPPGRGPLPLTIDSYGDYFEGQYPYASSADLNAFFPDGTYSFDLRTVHGGPVTVSLTLTGGSYPNDPSIVNFNAAQTIDPAMDFTLNWTPFDNGTASDFVFVKINDDSGDTVLYSPDPGEPGALTGASSPSYLIPAGTLSPGRTYRGELLVVKVVQFDTTTYPGVTALAAYLKMLDFELRTSGNTPPPQLQMQKVGQQGLALTISGEKYRTYAIEASSNLRDWYSLALQTVSADGSAFFYDWTSWFFPKRFYRVREFDSEQGVLVTGRVVSAVGATPVAWAVVSCSIDGQLAMTDADGNFSLALGVVGNYDSTPYTITVAADGFQTYSETSAWGNFPHVEIQLSP